MKKWYAVQIGGETDCGTGSHNKREALKIAKRLHREFPNEEIGLCTCAPGCDYCLCFQVIYDSGNL